MDSIKADELYGLVQRIIASGALGRSNTYAKILEYLLECTFSGTTPKEVTIAIDVLGRDSDFDVANSSVVRVYVYHLRNKLKAYHAKYGKNENYRIVIPKGRYILTAVPNDDIEQQPEEENTNKATLFSPHLSLWVFLLIAVLLSANLLLKFAPTPSDHSVKAHYPSLWHGIIKDDEPILLVTGDYYIFGELDESGNVRRMIREFSLNSPDDLKNDQRFNLDKRKRYVDIGLTYVPTSTPFALAQVLKLLGERSAGVKVKMMSELSTADLLGNHIIYIGYLSGLGKMEKLVFASSNLYLGSSYDELHNFESNERYTSNSAFAMSKLGFQDYGMVSTFSSPGRHRFVVIAGMRDQGLINAAQQVTDFVRLSALEKQLGIDPTGSETAYEALFEVVGFDNTNVDAKLVYSSALDIDTDW